VERVVRMQYERGQAKVKLCFSDDYCEELEYEVLETEFFEQELAKLIERMCEDQVISCVSESCREFWELWSRS